MTRLCLGFDRGEHPGSELIQYMYENSSLAFCGPYLAPPPGHQDTGWMDGNGEELPDKMAEILHAQGWGIAPVFYGRQTTDVDSPNSAAFTNLDKDGGTADAQTAKFLAAEACLANGVIYLDIETGTLDKTADDYESMLAYALAWIDEVTNGPYSAGAYAHQNWIDELMANLAEIFGWVVRFQAAGVPDIDENGVVISPGDQKSVGTRDIVWQYVLDWAGSLTFSDELGSTRQLGNLAFDVSNFSNPSFPAGGCQDKAARQVQALGSAQTVVVGGDPIRLKVSTAGPAPVPLGLLVKLSLADATMGTIVGGLPASVRVLPATTQSTISIPTAEVTEASEVTIQAQAQFQEASVSTQTTVQPKG